jgi:excisionase family DNA binding protein
MSKTTTPSPYMTRAEAAKYLGVTTRGLDLMIADGRLKAYQLGSRVIRLRRDEIDAALQPYGDGVA